MLLGDFHIHTKWSDGRLELPEVVDLFGRSGHDVIAITDHVVNTDCLLGKAAHRLGLSLNRETFPQYRDQIERESRRAWDQYRMIVIPGFELTRNSLSRNRSAHALALGVDEFLTADGSVEQMLIGARDHGSVVVACHPHEMSSWFCDTRYLWNRRKEMSDLVHLWELACQWDIFPPIARARLPFIGNSDFHDPSHLHAWKTLLDCPKNQNAVIQTMKSGVGMGVTRLPAVSQALAPLPAAACEVAA